jgi:hypothetical protein
LANPPNVEGESTDSEQDNRSCTGVDGPCWGDDGLLDGLAGNSVAVSARGGVGASHVTLNSHSAASAARVPSIIGGGSLFSTACSVVATGNYFNETAHCYCHGVVSAQKVVCPKDKHGAQGLCNYSWHHAAATAALPELFGVPKHFHMKNLVGELSYKYKGIQSEYVGNLDKLQLFWK